MIVGKKEKKTFCAMDFCLPRHDSRNKEMTLVYSIAIALESLVGFVVICLVVLCSITFKLSFVDIFVLVIFTSVEIKKKHRLIDYVINVGINSFSL